jgi:hypothetical protein
MSIWMAIHPRCTETRVLATDGVKETLLKARLAVDPSHPRALPTLLEAVALWQGQKVHAALIADSVAGASGSSLLHDCFAIFEPTPLFQLEMVDGCQSRRRCKAITGLGDFRDLRQLLLWEVAR